MFLDLAAEDCKTPPLSYHVIETRGPQLKENMVVRFLRCIFFDIS